MKYLIVSDIHGSIESTEFIINKFNELNCEKILCLGDVLYHGPRNDLPPHYEPKKVISLLNKYADKILCVKGNCEAEVDQMVLDFNITDQIDLLIENKKFHLEHGHHLDLYEGDADVILSGHTHIPKLEIIEGQAFINPGSITIPKNNSTRNYMILDEKEITCLNMAGEVIFTFKY